MLVSRNVALAFITLVSMGAARADAVKTEQADTPAAQEQSASKTSEDGKPHIAVAAQTDGDATPVAAAAAPAVGETATAVEPAKPVAAPAPSPTLTVKIDLALQQMVVSENGDAKYSWPISSGTSEFPTPRGTFRPQWTAKMWYSRKYDNAPMPHAVFINGGVAVHATSHVSRLGSPASHGCIRLAPGNARTFYNLVQRHGLKMSRVSVYGTPKWSTQAVASRKTKPQRYAYATQQYQSDDGWSFFGGSKKYYQPTSAYDPAFNKRRVRVAQPGYYPTNKRVYYRAPNGQRVVYVQRPPRPAYTYNNSGW